MKQVGTGNEATWEAELKPDDRVIISRHNQKSMVEYRRLGNQPDMYLGQEATLRRWDAQDGSWHIQCDTTELGFTWFHEDCLDLVPAVSEADVEAALASIALSSGGRAVVTPNERILEILLTVADSDGWESLPSMERFQTLKFIEMIESKIDTLRPEGAA